jgi:hypothetical protein
MPAHLTATTTAIAEVSAQALRNRPVVFAMYLNAEGRLIS